MSPAPNNSDDRAKQFGINSERVPNNSESIPDSAQNAPDALNIPAYQKENGVGRKRKNEDTGIYGDIPIKDIVLFRHIKQRHFPGLSADMREWYEHFYFKLPAVGEQTFRGKDYEQHKRAYDRGRQWIAAYEAAKSSTANAATVGDSRAAIIPFPKSANG